MARAIRRAPMLLGLLGHAGLRRAVGLSLPAEGSDLDTAADFNLDAGCLPEERKNTALMFQRQFDERGWAKHVADAFGALETDVYMTVGDGRSEPLLRNWMLQAEKMAESERTEMTVVNVALDDAGFKACQRIRGSPRRQRVKVECVGLAGWLPREFFSESARKDREKGGASVGSCAYNVIIWTKPVILQAAMRATQHGILMIDTDVVLYKDLRPLAKQAMHDDANVTIVAGREYRFSGIKWGANTGTVYVQQNRSSDIMSQWVEKDADCLNDEHGDQAAFHLMFKWQWFPFRKRVDVVDEKGHKERKLLEFPGVSNQLFKIPNELIGQCAEKGEYATHYNCYTNKLGQMKKKGAWDANALSDDVDSDDTSAVGERHAFARRRASSGLVSQLHGVDQKVSHMMANGDWLLGLDDEDLQ